MGRCCYCGSLTHKNSGRTFHKFPTKNPKLLEKWLEKLPLKNWKPKETTIICSDHFAADCLDKTGFRTRLHVDSVPTIFDDPRRLCVYCRRKREPQDKNIFFKFPHESPELLRKWVENMNIPGWWPKAESVLCSRHFESSTMIFRRGKSWKLKAESVPTLFSHENASASNFKAIHGISMDQSAEIDENLMDQSAGMILKRGKSGKLKAENVLPLFSHGNASASNFEAIHGISMDQSAKIDENSMDQSAGMILKRGKSGKLKAENVLPLFSHGNASASNFEAIHGISMDQSVKIDGNLMDQAVKIDENSVDQSVKISENLMDQSAEINGNSMDQSEEINGNLMNQSAAMIIERGKSGKLKAESVSNLFSHKNANASNFEAIHGISMDQSAEIDENSMDKSAKINGNSMNQSAEISENSPNLKELNYDEKVDNFDIDRIFLDFPNSKLPFFDETEVPNGNYEISNYCDTEDIFNGLNKRGSGDLIDNKIAEYEKSIEDKERTIELQEKKIKQLQNQISSFKEVIFELCRDRSVPQTISRNFGFIDGEN